MNTHSLVTTKTPHRSVAPWHLEGRFISDTYDESPQKPKLSTCPFHEQGNTGRTPNILGAKRAGPGSPWINSPESQTVNGEKNYHWTLPELDGFWFPSSLPLHWAQEAWLTTILNSLPQVGKFPRYTYPVASRHAYNGKPGELCKEGEGDPLSAPPVCQAFHMAMEVIQLKFPNCEEAIALPIYNYKSLESPRGRVTWPQPFSRDCIQTPHVSTLCLFQEIHRSRSGNRAAFEKGMLKTQHYKVIYHLKHKQQRLQIHAYSQSKTLFISKSPSFSSSNSFKNVYQSLIYLPSLWERTSST